MGISKLLLPLAHLIVVGFAVFSKAMHKLVSELYLLLNHIVYDAVFDMDFPPKIVGLLWPVDSCPMILTV